MSETYTDNVALKETGRRHDFVTEVSPGVRIEAETAALKANLDYAYKEIIYGRDTVPNRRQNNLRATGRLEAVDDRLFVDFSGAIARQTISAFGAQSPGDSALNENSSETATYRVSPYWRGRLGGYTHYELRYASAVQRTDNRSRTGSATGEWSGSLGGQTPSALLAWSVDARTQRVRYEGQRESSADSAAIRLSVRPDVQYRGWASAGREYNDYTSLEKTGFTTTGVGFDWSPGPRTQLSVAREWRFFGQADSLSLNHRTPRSAWRLGHSRSVSVMPNQAAVVGLGTVYELLYNQLSSSYPDPAARADAVNAFLAASGIPADTVVTTGFLTERVTVQRRSEVSAVLLGQRNSLTIAGSHTDSRRLQPGILGDDFDTLDRLRQTGISATWSYKLSPVSSLNATGSRQRSSGKGGVDVATVMRSAQIALQTQAGPALGFSLALRRVRSEGVTGYQENAAVGTITYKF